MDIEKYKLKTNKIKKNLQKSMGTVEINNNKTMWKIIHGFLNLKNLFHSVNQR